MDGLEIAEDGIVFKKSDLESEWCSSNEQMKLISEENNFEIQSYLQRSYLLIQIVPNVLKVLKNWKTEIWKYTIPYNKAKIFCWWESCDKKESSRKATTWTLWWDWTVTLVWSQLRTCYSLFLRNEEKGSCVSFVWTELWCRTYLAANGGLCRNLSMMDLHFLLISSSDRAGSSIVLTTGSGFTVKANKQPQSQQCV